MEKGFSQSSHLSFTEIEMHRTCYTQEVGCILEHSGRQCDGPGSATKKVFGSNVEQLSMKSSLVLMNNNEKIMMECLEMLLSYQKGIQMCLQVKCLIHKLNQSLTEAAFIDYAIEKQEQFESYLAGFRLYLQFIKLNIKQTITINKHIFVPQWSFQFVSVKTSIPKECQPFRFGSYTRNNSLKQFNDFSYV